MLSRVVLPSFGGDGFCPEARVEPGVIFLFSDGLDLGDTPFVELAFLIASGLVVVTDGDFVDEPLLVEIGDSPGEATVLFCARGLVVAFLTDVPFLVATGLPFGLPLAEFDLLTEDGERMEVLPLTVSLLPVPVDEEEPLVLLAADVDNLKLELPFLPATGLPRGEETLAEVEVRVGPLVEVLDKGETRLLVDVFELDLTLESPRTLSIIPTTLNSIDVWDCPLFSGGVMNLSDALS